MLIDVLPATKAKMRILNTIYNNRDINIRNIIKLSKTSPNLAVDYVNKLEKYNIAKIKKIGGTKKNYVKAVSFNFKAPLSRFFYAIIEISRKEELIKKYAILKPFIAQIENIKSGIIVLIYGSYARFAADKESDVDLWVVGNINKTVKRDIEEIFVTLPVKYSIGIETKKEFLKKIRDAIHQNILRDKVIIKNENAFFEIPAKL